MKLHHRIESEIQDIEKILDKMYVDDSSDVETCRDKIKTCLSSIREINSELQKLDID